MFVADCPNCSHPSPVSLASPDTTTCPACGHTEHLPGEVRRRLASAAAWLKSVDVRERQLNAGQKKALTAGTKRTCGLLTLSGLLVGPGLLWGLIITIWFLGDGTRLFDALLLILGFGPVAIIVITTWLGVRSIERARSTLAISVAADPPTPESNAVGRCRVCGADLFSDGGPIARCDFCGADSVVLKGVVTEARAGKQHAVLNDFESVVAKANRTTKGTATGATIGVIAAFVGAPIFTYTGAIVLFIAAFAWDTGPNLELRYMLVDTPAGRCVVGMSPVWLQPNSYWPSWGQLDKDERPSIEMFRGLRDDQLFDARWVVGKRVSYRRRGNRQWGVVTKIESSIAGLSNDAEVNGHDTEVSGLCLTEPAPGLPQSHPPSAPPLPSTTIPPPPTPTVPSLP